MEELKKPADDQVAQPKLTLESIKTKSHLEINVEGNFDATLAKLNEKFGIQLKSRPEGFHITVIGPTESKVLQTMTQEQLDKLQAISDRLKNGQGVHIDGIGFIDGADTTRTDIREADRTKKTSFLAFSSPDIQEFRKSLGLPEKDLHITLGFVEPAGGVGGDIHMRIVGVDDKGKPKPGPIEKKTDPALRDLFLAEFPNMHIKVGGEVGGPEKQKKQEK
ncbi:MAG: hypothetical protein HY226_02600 [Candidatus Vogelbacteria bacterium]|nr:hypothetical protein [Candidatus Vogelbacteria bacterium]